MNDIGRRQLLAAAAAAATTSVASASTHPDDDDDHQGLHCFEGVFLRVQALDECESCRVVVQVGCEKFVSGKPFKLCPLKGTFYLDHDSNTTKYSLDLPFGAEPTVSMLAHHPKSKKCLTRVNVEITIAPGPDP